MLAQIKAEEKNIKLQIEVQKVTNKFILIVFNLLYSRSHEIVVST